MTVPVQPESRSRSRRALLAGALGGLAAWAASSVDKVSPTRAAAGDPLIVGSTTNTAGSANTSLSTTSSGTALLVTQDGSGTALRGSAVGLGSIAGFFTAQNGTGISGVTGNSGSYGIFAQNNGAAGTAGAIRAVGGNNHGLISTTGLASKDAIVANNTGANGSGVAIRASGGNNVGVRGSSVSQQGVVGESTNSFGVLGTSATWIGLVGQSPIGTGVRGDSSGDSGVLGSSSAGTSGPPAAGVYGYGLGATHGVYGFSEGGYAGYFEGNTHVAGTLSKSAGTFKIDHPLDPANQYLQHSFVESPDMKNVYDGVVTLDAKGDARVKLPSYFEALNRDVRYQLTAVGAAAPDLHVKAKLDKGSFVVGGGSPGLEVCWQVTGIRQDPYAKKHPIVVEEAKSAKDKGKFLHPELYGQPKTKAMHPVPELPALEAPIR
jgi:hypothetical protein